MSPIEVTGPLKTRMEFTGAEPSITWPTSVEETGGKSIAFWRGGPNAGVFGGHINIEWPEIFAGMLPDGLDEILFGV